jgi:LmbE family N-acetylglucosaminyl deacetylase
MDSVEGTDRDNAPIRPDFGVNIEPFFAKKRDMLAAHASQRNWLLRQHGMDDYLRTMEEWTHQRGQSLGVKYAEGFRQYKHHPYPTSPLLQELVGEALLR